MSGVPKRLGNYPRPALFVLAACMMFSTLGCGSVPMVTDRSLGGALSGFGSKAKQKAFRQQVENDPFPTASRVGL